MSDELYISFELLSGFFFFLVTQLRPKKKIGVFQETVWKTLAILISSWLLLKLFISLVAK